MTEHLLAQSLLLILASALAVGLFAASRMPAAMGYLLASLAIGPYGLNLVAPGDDTRFLAELGLVFLMFMVGLEFSLATLLAARTDVLLAGSLQVAATLTTIAAALWWLGLDLRLAIRLGGAAAMSSTAVAVKQLAEQGEISSQHGRFAIGILLFQDIERFPSRRRGQLVKAGIDDHSTRGVSGWRRSRSRPSLWCLAPRPYSACRRGRPFSDLFLLTAFSWRWAPPGSPISRGSPCRSVRSSPAW
jgi:hypothetical protein